jgi:hypothetical protein
MIPICFRSSSAKERAGHAAKSAISTTEAKLSLVLFLTTAHVFTKIWQLLRPDDAGGLSEQMGKFVIEPTLPNWCHFSEGLASH